MEATFSDTFQNLYMDVLRYQGRNPNTIDANELTSAKKRVNDAYKRFLSINWSFKQRLTTITLQHGKNEYELPDDFAILVTPFKLFPYMGWVNPAEVPIDRLLQFMSFYPRTGIPCYFALKQDYSPNEGVRYKVIFYPTPHVNLTYNYQYDVQPNILVNDNDIPLCPADTSLCLRAFCLSEVETYDEEGTRSTWTNLLFNTILPESIKNDSHKRPRSAGDMNNYADDLSAGNWPTIHPRFGNTMQYGTGPVMPV